MTDNMQTPLERAMQAQLSDLLTYGIYIEKDGKRIDPLDFYTEPQESDAQAMLDTAIKGE